MSFKMDEMQKQLDEQQLQLKQQQEFIEQLCSNMRINFMCKICNKIFDSPIDLPCLNTICKSHLNELKETKCIFCNQLHDFLIEEPNINEVLSQTIALDLHLTNQEKILKKEIEQKLAQTKVQTFDLTNNLVETESLSFDHFAEIMNKIDLKKERLKEKLEDIADELIRQTKECKYELENDLKSHALKKVLSQKEIQNLELSFNEYARNVTNVKENFEIIKSSLFDNKVNLDEKSNCVNKCKARLSDFSAEINSAIFDESIFGVFKLKIINLPINEAEDIKIPE